MVFFNTCPLLADPSLAHLPNAHYFSKPGRSIHHRIPPSRVACLAGAGSPSEVFPLRLLASLAGQNLSEASKLAVEQLPTMAVQPKRTNYKQHTKVSSGLWLQS